jgi:hypothetical protein
MNGSNEKRNSNGHTLNVSPPVCGGLRKRCNECNYKFTKEDTRLGREKGEHICPECGTVRDTCKSTKLMANGRCNSHAGATLNGIASPQYQGKSYSRYLPKAVLEDYNTALSDPELIQLRSEMALVEARMSAVLRQLGSGESGMTWRKAQDSMRDLLRALQMPADDPQAATLQAQALTDLRTTIDKGSGDYMLWDELRVLIDAKRKLVESETRRMVAGKMYMTLDRFGLVFNALLRAVTSNVADRVTRGRIQDDWNRIMGGPREQMIDVESMDSAEVEE